MDIQPAHKPRPPGSELTPQALLAAVIVAAIMGASYPYMVLKLGFGPNVSIVAAFFGFVILSLISRKTYDRWQNNIVQTAGTSAAQTSFMCILLATFEMLRASKVVHFTINPTPAQTFIWLSVSSLLGVLLAVPMRRHFIVDEKLPFPDGMAAGETLMVLDPPRNLGKGDPEFDQARRAALVLVGGLIASGLLMFFRDDSKLIPVIPEGWDPGVLTLGAAGASFVVATMGVGLSYNLLSIGGGMLISFRVNFWMLVGGMLGWIVAPMLLIGGGILPDHATRTQVLYWIMWPGIGIIMSGGLTMLALRWRLLVQAFSAMGEASISGEEFPLSLVIGGVAVLTVALCLIQWLFFGMPIWMTMVSVVMAIPLMLVGLRALGETNWGPIGTLQNLTQGLFAAFSPGNAVAITLGGGTTGTVAVTSEGLIQDYKAGYIIGSTPRVMTIAQLIGAPIGAAALAVTYPALVKAYGIVGDHAGLSAPGSRRTAGFVELLSTGVDKLPQSAMWAMLISVVLGVLFAVLESRPGLKRWTPSPTGLSLGALLPFSAVSTIFVGGALAEIWKRRSPTIAGIYLVPLASGLIAGEAMVAVIAPLLLALGVGHR